MSETKVEIDLSEESFNLLRARGRSKSFGGQFKRGQEVTARCGDESQSAKIDSAGRSTWVAKTV